MARASARSSAALDTESAWRRARRAAIDARLICQSDMVAAPMSQAHCPYGDYGMDWRHPLHPTSVKCAAANAVGLSRRAEMTKVRTCCGGSFQWKRSIQRPEMICQAIKREIGKLSR
jgi:hypothetical protein